MVNVWKDISGYEGKYKVSIYGKVKNANGYKIVVHKYPSGYCYVDLYDNGKREHKYVHRLVLEAFVGPCPQGMECRHLDGDRTNNSLGNLKWGTRIENAQDRKRHGTYQYGEKNPGNKLTEKDVLEIVEELQDKKLTYKQIGEKHGVKFGTVGDIARGSSWAWLTRLDDIKNLDYQLSDYEIFLIKCNYNKRLYDPIHKGNRISSYVWLAEAFVVGKNSIWRAVNSVS